MPDRNVSNAKNRENIQHKLEMCIEPLNSDNNPEGIINIITGRNAPDAVNVTNHVATGKEPMKQFETRWPESFYQTKWLPCLSDISISN